MRSRFNLFWLMSSGIWLIWVTNTRRGIHWFDFIAQNHAKNWSLTQQAEYWIFTLAWIWIVTSSNSSQKIAPLEFGLGAILIENVAHNQRRLNLQLGSTKERSSSTSNSLAQTTNHPQTRTRPSFAKTRIWIGNANQDASANAQHLLQTGVNFDTWVSNWRRREIGMGIGMRN